MNDEQLKRYREQEKVFDRQVNRNLLGIKHEKSGEVDKAIKLYEQNVKEKFIGNHPYNRLAIIYKKLNRPDDELRIVKAGIKMFKSQKKEWFEKRLKRLES